jgi:flagellar basal body-associated protein FliL
LHFACAFGASEDVLRILYEAFPLALIMKDQEGRNPLHFALANATTIPRQAPNVVRFILNLKPNLVNPDDDSGKNPFLFLLEHATHFNRIEDRKGALQRDSITKCLELLLAAGPRPTPTMFTALRSLPHWLFKKAILNRTIQVMMKNKIKGRFPTTLLMLDFFTQVMVIYFYQALVVRSIELRQPATTEIDQSLQVLPLYVGAAYFGIRELVQIGSVFIARKSIVLFFTDLLDMMYVAVVVYWAYEIQNAKQELRDFQIGAALSAGVLWTKLLVYLRGISIDFSVFLSGAFYVTRRVSVYISILIMTIYAFSTMFHAMFYKSEYCDDEALEYTKLTDRKKVALEQCQLIPRSYCTSRTSFLATFSMLLGEVSEEQFLKLSRPAVFLYVLFIFLVVILLANILIAVVTQSYKVIQDQEATVVFYTNRLDFLAQTDAISNGPWSRLLPRDAAKETTWIRDTWHSLINELAYSHRNVSTMEYVLYTLPRQLIIVLVICPIWMMLGFVTAGWLFPPQLGQDLFDSKRWQRRFKSQTENEKQYYRRREEAQLGKEVQLTREFFYEGLSANRQQYAQIKVGVAERKQEIQKEMKQIKRIMENLFQQQAS